MESKFNAFENYVAESDKCVKIKLVTSADDLEEDFEHSNGNNENGDDKRDHKPPKIPPFTPEMSYQIFPGEGNIFGFKDLTVKVYYSCGWLNIYLGLDYEDRLTKEQAVGIEPDDVIEMISAKFETKVTRSLEEFRSNLSKEKSFVPYGEKIKEFSAKPRYVQDNNGNSHQFCIFKATVAVPGFRAYHERLQTFLWWFLEGASYIEIDDDRWDIFVVYEKFPLNENEFQYCLAGYCTVYRFWAYPQNIRPRISQFLLLPPFQRCGIGSQLLEVIYQNYNNDDSVIDITVEDPSPGFQRLRDIVDCRVVSRIDGFSLDKLKLQRQFIPAWNTELVDELRARCKLNRKQIRRVLEILTLKVTNVEDPEQYSAYRLAIKHQLNAPYNKQMKNLKRMYRRRLISKAKYLLLAKTNQAPLEYRIRNLQTQYEAIEKEYLQIIQKI